EYTALLRVDTSWAVSPGIYCKATIDCAAHSPVRSLRRYVRVFWLANHIFSLDCLEKLSKNVSMKRLPPLNFVRVFECSARHGNLHRAAEELGVTPGAVSQQIRSLETNLGLPLFERVHKKLRLTTAGQIGRASCR